VLAFVDTGGALSLRYNAVLIAYSDSNVTNALVSEWVPGSETTPYLVLNDTVAVLSSAGGAPYIDTVSTTARCSDTPGLANPLAGLTPIEYSGSICRIGTFAVGLEPQPFPVSGADSAFATVEIPDQNVSGIWVTNPPSGARLLRTR